MIEFDLELWWACRQRPFFVGAQRISIRARTEWQALARALGREPAGPFLHEGAGCCYVADVRLLSSRIVSGGSFAFTIAVPFQLRPAVPDEEA